MVRIITHTVCHTFGFRMCQKLTAPSNTPLNCVAQAQRIQAGKGNK